MQERISHLRVNVTAETDIERICTFRAKVTQNAKGLICNQTSEESKAFKTWIKTAQPERTKDINSLSSASTAAPRSRETWPWFPDSRGVKAMRSGFQLAQAAILPEQSQLKPMPLVCPVTASPVVLIRPPVRSGCAGP